MLCLSFPPAESPVSGASSFDRFWPRSVTSRAPRNLTLTWGGGGLPMNVERRQAATPSRHQAVSSILACGLGVAHKAGEYVPPADQASIMFAHSCSMCRRCSAYSALL